MEKTKSKGREGEAERVSGCEVTEWEGRMEKCGGNRKLTSSQNGKEKETHRKNKCGGGKGEDRKVNAVMRMTG
jgi:hypothetical protein